MNTFDSIRIDFVIQTHTLTLQNCSAGAVLIKIYWTHFEMPFRADPKSSEKRHCRWKWDNFVSLCTTPDLILYRINRSDAFYLSAWLSWTKPKFNFKLDHIEGKKTRSHFYFRYGKNHWKFVTRFDRTLFLISKIHTFIAFGHLTTRHFLILTSNEHKNNAAESKIMRKNNRFRWKWHRFDIISKLITTSSLLWEIVLMERFDR